MDRISFRQITPVGSLRNSLYVAESSPTTSDPDLGVFDICLISMFDIEKSRKYIYKSQIDVALFTVLLALSLF
jgi:hypothetical protein